MPKEIGFHAKGTPVSGVSANIASGQHASLAFMSRDARFWTKRRFRPTAPLELQGGKADHTRRFNPPWNTIGRKEGVI